MYVCILCYSDIVLRVRNYGTFVLTFAYIGENCLLRDLGDTPITSIAIYWQIEDMAKVSFRVIKNFNARACTVPLLSTYVLKTPHHLWQKK